VTDQRQAGHPVHDFRQARAHPRAPAGSEHDRRGSTIVGSSQDPSTGHLPATLTRAADIGTASRPVRAS
jgi:hypothetical protein